jgi:phospholipid/cholesterol/gamma-HCH transport system substrate-binding protein
MRKPAPLARSLNNMDVITANLAKNNDAISSSIRNIEVTTGNLANAPIQQTFRDWKAHFGDLRGTINEMKGMVSRINSPNGTLGALLNDKKLYDQLNRAALGLEILLDDVRVHPKRYVNISVFGGKKGADALTSPAVKDTLPLPVSRR